MIITCNLTNIITQHDDLIDYVQVIASPKSCYNQQVLVEMWWMSGRTMLLVSLVLVEAYLRYPAYSLDYVSKVGKKSYSLRWGGCGKKLSWWFWKMVRRDYKLLRHDYKLFRHDHKLLRHDNDMILQTINLMQLTMNQLKICRVLFPRFGVYCDCPENRRK